jgi:hypothetical protein
MVVFEILLIQFKKKNYNIYFQVVLSLAKMELDNFFKSVMPVADYFDQSDNLIAVIND